MGHESVFGVVRDATPEILVDNFPNSIEKVNVSLSRGYPKRLVHFVDGIFRDAVRAKAPCAAEAADLYTSKGLLSEGTLRVGEVDCVPAA
jgi:hypothetical protein